MSATFLEFFPGEVNPGRPTKIDTTTRLERRKRVRAGIHWPLVLFRANRSQTIETVTQNLSSGGFYCRLDSPFVPGERLVCSLKVPNVELAEQERRLECEIRVVRVDCSGTSYGIAFQIEDYRVVPGERPIS